MITQEQLKASFLYNPATGFFVRYSTMRRETRTNRDGYIIIRVKKKQYLAHRLAWLYMYGWVPRMLDHKNRIKADNRLDNLRATSPSENSLNTPRSDNPKKQWPCPATKTTILPDDFGTGDGVYYRKDRNTWRVRARTGGGKRVSVGCFKTEEEAVEAYRTYRVDCPAKPN